MLRVAARRLRFICYGMVSTAAMLACGMERAEIGVASAQIQGVQRATERLGGAETVALDNVAIDLGFAVYRMPNIEFAGVNLSRAELLTLFDKNAPGPVGLRLARLSAKTCPRPPGSIPSAPAPRRLR